MAISPFKSFVAGEILTASDLNSSFLQITGNGEDLGFPRTKAADFNGNELVLDSDGDTSIHASTDDRIDLKTAGFDTLRVDGTVASPVNGAALVAGATGNAARVRGRGEANQGLGFDDSNGNQIFDLAAVASAVNQARLTNSVTGSPVLLETLGDDTNVDLLMLLKGLGDLVVRNSDDTAVAAPQLVLDRLSASPAAADVLAEIIWRARNAAAEEIDGAALQATLDDPTDGSEDFTLALNTTRAGTAATRFQFRSGMFGASATGGDPGAGGINGEIMQEQGVSLGFAHAVGAEMSNNTLDSDHDVDIAAGYARDTTNTRYINLGSALIKQIDAAWAVGTNAGWLDTGTVAADTFYYVFLIRRSDTGVVDCLASTSSTAPTMPANYDSKAYIGAVKTDGSSNIVAFLQSGDTFWYKARQDIVLGVSATADTTQSVSGEIPAHATSYRMEVEALHTTGSNDHNFYVRLTSGVDWAQVRIKSPGAVSSQGVANTVHMDMPPNGLEFVMVWSSAVSGRSANIRALSWTDKRGVTV